MWPFSSSLIQPQAHPANIFQRLFMSLVILLSPSFGLSYTVKAELLVVFIQLVFLFISTVVCYTHQYTETH